MPGSSIAGPAPTHPPPGQSGTSFSLVTFKLPLAESPQRARAGPRTSNGPRRPRTRARSRRIKRRRRRRRRSAPRRSRAGPRSARRKRPSSTRATTSGAAARRAARRAPARARAGPTSKHSVHPAISKSGPRAPPTHLGMTFESFVRGWPVAALGNLIHGRTRLANLIHGQDCGSFRIFVLIELVAASARMIHHRVAGSE